MPIHILYGEDEFLQTRHIEKIKNKLLSEGTQYLSTSNTSSTEAAAGQYSTLGLFGRKVVVLLQEKLSKEDWETINKSQTGDGQNIMVVRCVSNPDRRLKAVKNILSSGAEIKEYTLIPEWQTKQFIDLAQKLAQEENIDIDKEAMRALVDKTGHNTSRLISELHKLDSYTSGRLITKEAVDELVENNNNSCFQLADALLHGRTENAVTIYRGLIESNEHPVKISAIITTQFLTWLNVRAGIEEKCEDSKVLALCSITNSNRLYYLKKEVEQIKFARLVKIIEILAELDLAVKSSAEIEIIPFLIKICQL